MPMTSQDSSGLSPISFRVIQPVRDSGFSPLPVLDRYRLSCLLGRGGMAEVFLAVWSVAPDVVRPVVVKRLYDHFSEDRNAVQMFIDEARLVCQLDHEHIVKTYEIGLIDGHLCIVMEYLEGQTLQQLIRRCLERSSGIPVQLAAYVGQAVLLGLRFAHEATDARGDASEIVHRDISPHNIFITNAGAVKILDFGIAKARTHEARTSTGVVKGKFAYIAPEQAAGLPVDGRADLFSLGVVLWEMLAGKRLFKADGDAATLNATLHREVPFLTNIRADVPLDLAVVVSRALQRDPAKRYPDAATMLGELEKYLRRIKPNPDKHALSELMHRHFAEEIPQQQQQVSNLVLLQGSSTETEPPPPISRQTDLNLERERDVEDRTRPESKRALVMGVGLATLTAIAICGALVWNAGRQPIEPSGSAPRIATQAAPARAAAPAAPAAVTAAQKSATEIASSEVPTSATPATLVPVAIAAVARAPSRSASAKPTIAKKVASSAASAADTSGTTSDLAVPTAKAYGMLTIDTTPWSNVFVDGKLLGTTPVIQAKLPVGAHALALRNPELGLEATYSVSIVENQTVSKRIGLR